MFLWNRDYDGVLEGRKDFTQLQISIEDLYEDGVLIVLTSIHEHLLTRAVFSKINHGHKFRHYQ